MLDPFTLHQGKDVFWEVTVLLFFRNKWVKLKNELQIYFQLLFYKLVHAITWRCLLHDLYLFI